MLCYNTGQTLSGNHTASATTLTINRLVSPPAGKPAFYPFKKSTTTATYSIDKTFHNPAVANAGYVSWIRIDNGIIRVNNVWWDSGTSKIKMTVARGRFGTTAASHSSNAKIMGPVYIGSVTGGADIPRPAMRLPP